MGELNGVMMQYFHWYVPADGTLWQEAAARARALAEAGITGVWLPWPTLSSCSGARAIPVSSTPTITAPNMRVSGATASASAWSCPPTAS